MYPLLLQLQPDRYILDTHWLFFLRWRVATLHHRRSCFSRRSQAMRCAMYRCPVYLARASNRRRPEHIRRIGRTLFSCVQSAGSSDCPFSCRVNRYFDVVHRNIERFEDISLRCSSPARLHRKRSQGFLPRCSCRPACPRSTVTWHFASPKKHPGILHIVLYCFDDSVC